MCKVDVSEQACVSGSPTNEKAPFSKLSKAPYQWEGSFLQALNLVSFSVKRTKLIYYLDKRKAHNIIKECAFVLWALRI